MHNTGFDAVCSNYTQDIQIVELTPYLLQLVTKRTNSEGNWYLVWNFVSEDVIATKGACIPKADQDLIETAKPKLPTFENIHTDLFTADINGDKYVGSKMTFNLDSETPYDFLWWNGSPNVKAWESVTGGKYNSTWAPALDDKAIDNFELTISKASDGSYNYECGEADGKVKITENTLTFDKEISVFAVAGDKRTIELKGNQFYILAIQLMISISPSVFLRQRMRMARLTLISWLSWLTRDRYGSIPVLPRWLSTIPSSTTRVSCGLEWLPPRRLPSLW